MPASRACDDQQGDAEEEHPNRLREPELIRPKAKYQCCDHQEQTNEIPNHSWTDLGETAVRWRGMAKPTSKTVARSATTLTNWLSRTRSQLSQEKYPGRQT
jgi:hypothetical protein